MPQDVSKAEQQPRNFDNFVSLCILGLVPQERDVVGQQTSQPSCQRQFLNDDQVLGYFEYLDKISSGCLISEQSFRQLDILIIKHEAKAVVCLDNTVILILGGNISSSGVTGMSFIPSHTCTQGNLVIPYSNHPRHHGPNLRTNLIEPTTSLFDTNFFCLQAFCYTSCIRLNSHQTAEDRLCQSRVRRTVAQLSNKTRTRLCQGGYLGLKGL